MKTVETVFSELVDYRKVMAELRQLLLEVDPSFCKEEAAYQEAVSHMLAVLPPERKALAQDLLEKQEEAVTGHMVFLAWEGLLQNLSCFHNPISKKFLDLDYEDIHKESIMQSMPMSRKYWSAADAYHRSASGEERPLYDDITSYYCYLDTVANKLAHYYGFLLGDKILPHLIPGYEPDISTTTQYGWMLEKYLNMHVQKVEK